MSQLVAPASDFVVAATELQPNYHNRGRMCRDKIQGLVPPDLDSYRF